MGDNSLNLNPSKTELLFVHQSALEAPVYLLRSPQIELLLNQQVETTDSGTLGQLWLVCQLELYLFT